MMPLEYKWTMSLFWRLTTATWPKVQNPIGPNRRKKQIYRADYVPYHFVHYSPVTKGLLKTYQDDPQAWTPYEEGYREKTERIVDEVHEAVMFHTKTIAAKDTKDSGQEVQGGEGRLPRRFSVAQGFGRQGPQNKRTRLLFQLLQEFKGGEILGSTITGCIEEPNEKCVRSILHSGYSSKQR
jgi:hypothetical protein